MARKYRFFVRHLTSESLREVPGSHLTLTDSLEPEMVFQLIRVLRVQPGDSVILIPAMQRSSNFEYIYTVTSVEKHTVQLVFTAKVSNHNELHIDLGLVFCLPNKPDKLDFILQKAVELGAKRIIVVQGDFSQMKHSLRQDRMEKIIREAAEQAERAVIPELTFAGKLTDYLTQTTAASRSQLYVAMERSTQSIDLIKLIRRDRPARIELLIGPEGGFSEAEKQLIDHAGIKTFSLGKRILRMETAAILSLGLFSIND